MNQGNKGIPESNAVDVAGLRALDDLPGIVVAAKEPIENRRVRSGPRSNRLRCTGTFRLRRRFDVVANEPSAEPPRRDLLDYGGWMSRQRARDRGEVLVVGDAQVFEALADAPLARTWRPGKLVRRQPLGQRRPPLVVGVEFGDQPEAPGWRRLFPRCGHASQ